MNLRLSTRFFVNFCAYLCLYCLLNVTKRNNRVLLIPQNWHVGGTKKYLKHLFEYLQEKDLEVYVLLEESEASSFKEQYHIEDQRIVKYQKSFRHPNVWYSEQHSLFRHFLLEFCEETVRLCRLLLSVRPGYVIASIARPTEMFFTFFLPGRAVYVLHTMPWIRCDNGNQAMLRWRFGGKRRIATVSHIAKNRIKSCWDIGDRSDDVFVVYNSTDRVDLEIPKKTHKNLRIVCLASAIKDKNPFFFINVAKHVLEGCSDLDISFEWYGKGVLLEECRELVSETRGITFYGEVLNSVEVLSSADIYFHPSINESHCFSVIEAMSIGVPCVVTNRGGTAESVLDRETGFVFDPDNEEQTVAQLIELIRNPALRESFGKKGKERYEAMFTPEIWKQKMDEVMDLR